MSNDADSAAPSREPFHVLAPGESPGVPARDDMAPGDSPGAKTGSSPGAKTNVEQVAALRILDAAANRAGEGLRVVEDYLRFALDDPHLTGECKRLRHELTDVLTAIPARDYHAARETLRDVGTEVSTPEEALRANLEAVAAASFKRTEQALRSLEEYAKVVAPDLAMRFERLRYALYTLERAADLTRDSLERLANARLYVLIDACDSPEAFAALARSLIDAGVHVLQLRDKRLSDRELLARGRQLRELTKGTNSLFIMNDRPDLARLSEADGVHVGQEELSLKDARSIIGPHALIGVSTHSIEQARQAVLDGANYLGVGPTFPSGTKSFERFTGVDLLRAVASEIRLPAFAIGGVSSKNIAEVLASGFSRIAVSGGVLNQSNPAAAARELLTGLNARL